MTDQWQSGNPPEFGWYLITVRSPVSGDYVLQAFFSKNGHWSPGSELMGTSDLPRLLSGDRVPVIAWMPLPKPPTTAPQAALAHP